MESQKICTFSINGGKYCFCAAESDPRKNTTPHFIKKIRNFHHYFITVAYFIKNVTAQPGVKETATPLSGCLKISMTLR